MNDRLLKESDVIEVVTQYISCDYPTEEMAREDAEVLIGRTPSADRPQDDDWEKYSDKLWKNAYERGKADRPQGEWIEQEDCWQCSECGDEYVLEVGVKPIDARMHYCPNCGARMLANDTNVPNKKGANDETN